MDKEIRPANGPLNATVRPPGSKSITNRALLCAAMARGTTTIRGALESDDTTVMSDSLSRLGISVACPEPGVFVVEGCGGKLPVKKATLYVGNSGTSVRFLTAMLALHGGDFLLDGNQRMQQRPIRDLVDALNGAGVKINAAESGCPPVNIQSEPFSSGRLQTRGNVSSQYLSGLLMAAPVANGDVTIRTTGEELVSRPYVDMTIRILNDFGISVQPDPDDTAQVPGWRLPGGQEFRSPEIYLVEPDASAASYFWAAAAICGGSVKVNGLNRDSIQGDVRFVECLQQAGCDVGYDEDSITVTGPATQPINVDMADISDTAQTLAAVALFLPGTTTITGIGHNRVKETDRIGNLAIELRKLGATVREEEDAMAITPGKMVPCEIDTYDDHRMAMSLSLVGLRHPGIVIRDSGCVSKTYPHYFRDLETAVFPQG